MCIFRKLDHDSAGYRNFSGKTTLNCHIYGHFTGKQRIGPGNKEIFIQKRKELWLSPKTPYLLTSIGCAGIPSAGLVVIFIVTQAVGFRDDQVAVIIGTMLAVDRPLDMIRTMVNVVSDSVGTVVVAKSEGEKDLYQAVINKTTTE